MNESHSPESNPHESDKSELEQRRELMRQAGQVVAEWAVALGKADQEGPLADLMLSNDSPLALLSEKILALASNVPIDREWPNDVMEIKIDNLDFSIRAYNALKRQGLDAVGDLARSSREALLRYPNMGPSIVNEIQAKLGTLGIGLQDE